LPKSLAGSGRTSLVLDLSGILIELYTTIK
jgi:hypothetical protein